MTAARHAIRRLTFEVRCRDVGAAPHLQDTIRGLIAADIAPLLARCLDAVADPEHHDRIERLELDLGILSSQRLRDELPTRIEERLRASLRAAIPVERRRDAVAAAPAGVPAVALIGHFLQTGRLPWWSEVRAGTPVIDAFDEAMRAAPAALAAVVRGFAGDFRSLSALNRLIRVLDDARLEALTAALAPTVAALPRPLLARLDQRQSDRQLDRDALRAAVWRQALRIAGTAAPTITPADSLGSILAGLTGVLATSLNTLVNALTDGAPGPAATTSASPPLDSALSALAARLPATSDRSAPAAADRGPAIVDAQLAAVLDESPWDAAAISRLLAALSPLVPALPAADRPHVLSAGDALTGRLADGGTPADGAKAVIRALVAPFLRHGTVTAEAVRRLLAAPPEAAADDPARTLPPPVSPMPTEFDVSDATFVENAGLVLIWPFIRDFFAQLGLAGEDGTFIDAAAPHRAAGLLHHAATGEATPPEYWLALNKVLCGMDLDAIHEWTGSVTAAEAAETQRMLTAVLAHGTALGELSIDGLRGTFLLRKGALTTRDGAWLLRVERQLCDIVLDRLPWTLEWIRLPWMPAPLRIEW